jgi:hypothetical protein
VSKAPYLALTYKMPFNPIMALKETKALLTTFPNGDYRTLPLQATEAWRLHPEYSSRCLGKPQHLPSSHSRSGLAVGRTFQALTKEASG